LFTIIADTCGRHDTIYGCCSEANNFLRYGVRDTPSCYANFCEILARFELDERSLVSNVNFFMSVPVLPDGSAGVAGGVSQPGSYVELRAERNVLASANAQPVQWLQPDTNPGRDLQASCGAGERVNCLTMLVRPTAGP